MTETIRGRVSFQHGLVGIHWEDKTKVEGIDGRWFTPADHNVKVAAVTTNGEVELTYIPDGSEYPTATAITRI